LAGAVNLVVGRSRGPGTTPEHVLASPYLLLGSINQIIEQLQRLRELFGISYFVVGDESMETFAPVVAQLIGK